MPAGYLRNFARDKRIAIRHVVDDRPTVANVAKAGVVKDFYRRRRPDGSFIQDIERSLDGLEGRVLPMLRRVPQQWPVSRDDKAAVAKFMAVQVLRSPEFRDFDAWRTAETFYEWRRNLLLSPDARVDVRAELEHLREQESFLALDSQRWMRAFDLIAKTASFYAAMHWSLLEVPVEADLCTSDHPIVPWPLRASAAVPGPMPLRQGLRPVLEVRFPVDRRHALLLTWLDEPDGKRVRVDGDIAANLNAFARGQARFQWFHHPDAVPRLHEGLLGPVSPQLFEGYGPRSFATSARRERLDHEIQPKIGHGSDHQITVVTIDAR